MTDDDHDRSCPPWCQEPAGHLHVETDGPGDYHTTELALIDLPEIPGLRGEAAVRVTIEQYVTASTTHPPMIVIDAGDGGELDGYGRLTPEEAHTTAAALRRAVTVVQTFGNQTTGPSDGDDGHG
ncbi:MULTISPECIES: DUF6907 domain-containing protein [Protofrankia]|uniref:DUF6907 domain-containing protein n=1 Tax=Protofrankia TaxID=2994361 RepID=UPI000640474B|nr:MULTISPECIES: hypothetical protein [Protofrankia]ONH34163.1 hypothetical protein BL254_17810 [Protofrankia sp. BMG5.30]